MRQLKLIVGASAVTSIAAWLAIVVLTLNITQIPWPFRLLPILFFVPTEWLLWRAIKPPVLKADATEITVSGAMGRGRMPRTELGFIFRGQVLRAGRYGKYWNKSYIFAGSDGKVGLSVTAARFTEEGVAEFAQRLQVPVRGDFSVQVKDLIDPSAT